MSMGCWINKPYSSIFLDLGYWRLGNLNVEISIAGPLAPHKSPIGQAQSCFISTAGTHARQTSINSVRKCAYVTVSGIRV